MVFWKRIFVVLVAFFVAFVTLVPCFAEEEKTEKAEKALSGEVSLAALSQYIWHGYEMSRNSVVLQPSFTLSYKGFSANIWGNWDSDPYAGGDRWNETDYTLSYEGEYGILNYGAGYMYYDMDGSDYSQEVSLKLGLNIPLSPTLTVYREVGHSRYWYFLLGVSHSFPLAKRLALDLSASAAYLVSTDKTAYPKVDGEGSETGSKYNNFHDGTLTIGLPYKISDNITITPTLSYTFPLCRDARREMKYFSMTGQDANFLYGGVIFAYSF
ncbi:MAG: hypothetical protein HGA29_04690 [Syntrophaceae bacterium]|nr:hypothetical protein [Syntrophaceae bacterium]